MVYPAHIVPPPPETVIDRVDILRNNIARRIKDLGLTQEAAAPRCGLTIRQLQRAMSGRHSPRLTTAIALAAGLDTTIDALYVTKIRRLKIRRSSS